MYLLYCLVYFEQARNLEKQCQIGNQKVQECHQKIEEAWSLAREEAEKCKAAKEIIKALAVRVSIVFLLLY